MFHNLRRNRQLIHKVLGVLELECVCVCHTDIDLREILSSKFLSYPELMIDTVELSSFYLGDVALH